MSDKPTVHVCTNVGKRALAAALAEHDPQFLDDLRLIAKYFGPQVVVYYASDDAETMAAVAGDVALARYEHIKKIR